MFQTTVLQKINTHIFMINNFFNRAVYEIN